MMNTKRLFGVWAWATLSAILLADEGALNGFQTGPATDFVRPAVVEPDEAEDRVKHADYRREEPEKKERYLLLGDRSVVAGFVTVADTHYVVERHGAKILFEKSRVQTVGDSVVDLYHFQASRIPAHDLPMRASLAQWCFDKGLLTEALAEAKLIQSIDPKHTDAERVIRLCRTKVRSENPETVDRTVSRRLRQPDPGRVVNQFKAAYGQDMFDHYKDFEGMLVASCGNAACHGSARHEGAFRIYRRTFNTNDSQVQTVNNDIKLTARNLMSILDCIDYRDPLRSPLLHKALERHGSSSLPPLGGVQDPTYLKLQEWVLAVSDRWSGNEKEIDPRMLKESLEDEGETFAGGRGDGPGSTLIIRRTARPQAPVLEPGDEIERVRHSPPLADDAPEPRPASSTKLPKKEPAEGTDPYDPSEFNSQTRTSKSATNGATSERSVEASSPRGGESRPKLARFVDVEGGKARVRTSMKIEGTDKQTPFEAAMPPISLAPGLGELESSGSNKPSKD